MTPISGQFSSLLLFNQHHLSLHSPLIVINIIIFIVIIGVSLCRRQALYVIISHSHRCSTARCYFHFINHTTGLAFKGAYEAIVEVQTIWNEHPCPSHSSTDRAPSCFPVLFSPGFVFCHEPWLLLWEFKDDPFIHLAVIYWVPFSALAVEQ